MDLGTVSSMGLESADWSQWIGLDWIGLGCLIGAFSGRFG
jgi:hypothetical protein